MLVPRTFRRLLHLGRNKEIIGTEGKIEKRRRIKEQKRHAKLDVVGGGR